VLSKSGFSPLEKVLGIHFRSEMALLLMSYPFTKKTIGRPIVNNKTIVKVSKNPYVLSKLIFSSLDNCSQVLHWVANDPLVDKISIYKRTSYPQYLTKTIEKALGSVGSAVF
jgi:hypothetical protein